MDVICGELVCLFRGIFRVLLYDLFFHPSLPSARQRVHKRPGGGQ
jgi:hypothetical protein